MEDRVGGEEEEEAAAHGFYSGPGVQKFVLRDKRRELIKQGKRNFEWDLNDWRWDGDLFIATPVNSIQATTQQQNLQLNGGRSSNNSSSCSDETNLNPVNQKEKRELEKRRRVVVYQEEEEEEEVVGEGNLTLKLGGHGYPIDEKYGKKSKMSNRTCCQVENCGADLSIEKDYHRRHKVCEVHSKASKALVGNVFQRFCQQCSRFQKLEEFDGEKKELSSAFSRA